MYTGDGSTHARIHLRALASGGSLLTPFVGTGNYSALIDGPQDRVAGNYATIEYPPSITTVCPVTKSLSAMRPTTVCATSSAVATRPSGVRSARRSIRR